MNSNSGGKFRKKKSNFSMISNEIIRDDTVSLKAKGLYALIQSYITLEDFSLYKGFLLSKCKEGKKAFDAAWKELKDAGLIQGEIETPKVKYCINRENWELARKLFTGFFGECKCTSCCE